MDRQTFFRPRLAFILMFWFSPNSWSDNVSTYELNRDKQLSRVVHHDGSQVLFSYLPNGGHLSSIAAPEGQFSRSYDKAGALLSADAPKSVHLGFDYVSANLNQVSLSTPDFSAQIHYSYLQNLRSGQTLTSSGGSNLQTNFGYDSQGRVIQAGDLGVLRDSLSGLIIKTQIGNVVENFTYDAQFKELQVYQVLFKGKEFFKEIYTYNSAGKITSKSVSEKRHTHLFSYLYDSQGRLVDVLKDQVKLHSYTYDRLANRSSVRQPSSVLRYSYDGQNRLSGFDQKQYSYSAKSDLLLGYRTANALSVEYAYDSLGALAKVVISSKESDNRFLAHASPQTRSDVYDYVTDGLGRRVARMKNGQLLEKYLYDESGRIVAELDRGGKILRSFVYVGSAGSPDLMIQNNLVYKFVRDQIGSVRYLINANNGEFRSNIDYDEFGVVQSGAINIAAQPFGFAGGIYDSATGLVHIGNRDYDPALGRWLSKAPFLYGAELSNPDYLVNDPINLNRP